MAEINENNKLWNGPSLLVPVDVEALVVSNDAQKKQWAINTYDYTNAGEFEDVRPNMFVNTGVDDSPPVGVTLHWALPDGLTHGREDASKKIKYPAVPNRWLVVRFYQGKSKAWVIQSDYLGDDGRNSFLNPNSPGIVPTNLGRMWELSSWPGEGGVKQETFLTALGPGNTAFAAFTPNVKNVFSFYDSMNDILNEEVKVSYSVSGWYGAADADPLAGLANEDDWRKRIAELQWTVGDIDDLKRAKSDWKNWAAANGITVNPDVFSDNYPTRTLCHGMVYKVNWLGRNGAVQSGVPTVDDSKPLQWQPKIAFGNTAIDALAALVEYELNLVGKDGRGAAELLEAFNYNLLDKYKEQGGQFSLYREVFKAWFAGNDGEHYYYIEDSENPDHPFIEPERLEKLVDLNRQAAELNAKRHLLAAAQKSLYGNWWKKAKADFNGQKKPQEIDKKDWSAVLANLKSEIPAATAAIEPMKAEVARLEKEVGDKITEISNGLAPRRSLKENVGDRYYEANDPVVLVYGAGRSYRHGEDGRFSDDDKMLVRFTGQTISGMSAKVAEKEQTVTTNDVPLPQVALPEGRMPKECGSLFGEAFIFDTRNAEAIARAACSLAGVPFNDEYAKLVEARQTGAWNADVYRIDRQLVADAIGFIGTIPSKIAVTSWTPPWAPLYMAWEVNWTPTYTTANDALKNWTFDSTKLEYEWDKKVDISSTVRVLRGTAPITPKSAFVMQAQLEKFFDETGEEFHDLKEFLRTISKWDFLTQNMSGLNNMLLALTGDQLNPPTDAKVAAAVDNNTQLAPVPSKTQAGFHPIRAGHFRLNRLWIIDDFGQVFDAISAVKQEAANYKPVAGTGLACEVSKKENYIQLPPRLTQNSRLNFDLLSGDGKPYNIEENQTANPICGWILPNHIDRGLSIYTPDGHLLGELLLTWGDTGMGLRWENAPGKNIPVGTPLDKIITNAYVRKFVEELLQRRDNAAAFQDFLGIIDETLWTIEPLGGRRNELVSVFIGRPLALVRGCMQYQLRSGLQYSQAWIDSTKKVTDGYEKVEFAVQLGCPQNPQDGTLGYFLDDFTSFSSLMKEEVKTETDYIGNKPISMSFSGGIKELFILADPRGEMNAISGILPIEVNVLPGPLVEEALANMNVTFRTGPLITDPNKLAMPLPSEISGSWSWIQHTGVNTWDEISDIAQANQSARFASNYRLKDGWLKLSNAVKKEQ